MLKNWTKQEIKELNESRHSNGILDEKHQIGVQNRKQKLEFLWSDSVTRMIYFE